MASHNNISNPRSNIGGVRMRIFYDTEFLEDGKTIELISIGMVAEDGDELYCINGEAPLEAIYQHEWLVKNVWPHLPLKYVSNFGPMWDEAHPDYYNKVWSRGVIANAVMKFIKSKPNPELWAWYGAYDHVVLAQLWGSMVKLPTDVPMWTNDLKQELTRLEKVLGKPLRYDLPKMSAYMEHNALADAKLLKLRAEWLDRQVG